jgi:hypothetical protein
LQASQFGFLHLVDVAQIENTTLQQFVAPNYFISPTRIDTLSQDCLTKYNIQHLLGDPYYVSDNGSCLFNVVSVPLCGTEDLAVELRVRTCIEMVIRKDYYTSLPIAQKLTWVSPNYASSSIDCAQPRGWSSAWTILALAQVIGMPNYCTYHTFFSHVNPFCARAKFLSFEG